MLEAVWGFRRDFGLGGKSNSEELGDKSAGDNLAL